MLLYLTAFFQKCSCFTNVQSCFGLPPPPRTVLKMPCIFEVAIVGGH
uniref:Uncharacterized protein n=1 Tax=Anguilla anguilla TaxID=7936 RepID=A0A0E9WC72_ANGAN